MSISDKTRKILWSRSGGKCALCRCDLVEGPTDEDSDSVVGEECHIVSGKPGGPRYDPTLALEHMDELENLIILCPRDHKRVDDQCQTFTVEKLQQLKLKHEKWVESTLSEGVPPFKARIRRIKENVPDILVRLTSGQDIIGIVAEACAYSLEHDEPKSDQEMRLMRDFLQQVSDCGEMWSTIEAGDRVEWLYRLSTLLRQIEEAGFRVFGAREIQRLEGGVGGPQSFPVAILRVVRSSSSEIMRIDLSGDSKMEETS